MTERYGVGENRPEAKGKVCGVCTKRIGRSSVVFLDKRYFHADCFFTSDSHGATEQQVRYLRVALQTVKTFSPIWKERRHAN